MSIVMYTKPGCPYCERAREYYRSEGIEFAEFDAMYDREHQKEMLEYTDGNPTVPTIVKNGKYIQSGWGDPPRG